MIRSLSALYVVWVAFLQREPRATILESESTSLGYGSGPETGVVARNEGTGVALRVGRWIGKTNPSAGKGAGRIYWVDLLVK
jgi:hypothetical protein